MGQTAPNPVLSPQHSFRHEYEAHINEKRCPAGHCSALLTYHINAELCRGCGLCVKFCAVQAISGQRKEPYLIDPTICIQCGVCVEKCPFDAITKG